MSEDLKLEQEFFCDPEAGTEFDVRAIDPNIVEPSTRHMDIFSVQFFKEKLFREIRQDPNLEVPYLLYQSRMSEVYVVPRRNRFYDGPNSNERDLVLKLQTGNSHKVNLLMAKNEACVLDDLSNLDGLVPKLWKFDPKHPLCPIWMEYFVDGDLKNLLHYGDLERFERLHISDSFLSAKSRIAEAGVVHRDYKPSNLLVPNYNRVVVADFGVSYSEGRNEDIRSHEDLFGTMAYLAPERIPTNRITNDLSEVDPEYYAKRAKERDGITQAVYSKSHQADDFSAGLIVGEICTGKMFFPLENTDLHGVLKFEREPDAFWEPYAQLMRESGYGRLVDGFVSATHPLPNGRSSLDKLHTAVVNEQTRTRRFMAPIQGWFERTLTWARGGEPLEYNPLENKNGVNVEAYKIVN